MSDNNEGGTNRFGTPIGPPVNQFGTPIGAYPATNPSAAPPYPPAAQPYPPAAQPYQPGPSPQGWPAQPLPPYGVSVGRPGMSTGAKVAIALAGAVGGLVVLGILAAIVIPIFAQQHAKAEAAHISVSLPEQVAGYQRMTGAADDALRQSLTGFPSEAGTPSSGVYGQGGSPVVAVVVGKHVMSSFDQTAFLSGATKSAKASGAVLVDHDPGPLGGRMRCGQVASPAETVCVFVDAGAFGRIEVAGSASSADQLVLTVRSQVEHRS